MNQEQDLFHASLIGAVSLLQEFGHRLEDTKESHSQFLRFQKEHLMVNANLVVDRPPGTKKVEYDILLRHPSGGTVALSWRADRGVPWPIEYADHWAANYVVSVDEYDLSTQDAFLFLKLAGQEYPDLMTELVHQIIVVRALEHEPPPVGEAELREATANFCKRRGISDDHTMNLWMEETGLSREQLNELLATNVKKRKLQERVTEKMIGPHFESNSKDFDTLTIFKLETNNRELAQKVTDEAKECGLKMAAENHIIVNGDHEVRALLTTAFAFEIAFPTEEIPVGALLGPVHGHQNSFWAAEVLGRRNAVLDLRTRNAIIDLLFRNWLKEQTSESTVRWHWM
jgi:putative peptide maturation system protein